MDTASYEEVNFTPPEGEQGVLFSHYLLTSSCCDLSCFYSQLFNLISQIVQIESTACTSKPRMKACVLVSSNTIIKSYCSLYYNSQLTNFSPSLQSSISHIQSAQDSEDFFVQIKAFTVCLLAYIDALCKTM